MRLVSAAVYLFGSALLFQDAVAQLTIRASGTRNGVPIPESELKFHRYDFGRSRNGKDDALLLPSPKHRMTKRANTQYSSANWCGSVASTTTSNKIKYIEANWVHPTCTKRTGQSYPQAVAVWSGIDGDTVTSSIIQAGTVCKFDNSSASARHEAWWQWYPSVSYGFASTLMPVFPGDWFNLKINMTSDTAGKLVITNLSRGTAITLDLSGGAALSRVDAVWTVERPIYGSGLAGFAKFSDIWFQDSLAVRNSGTNLQPLGAKQYYMSGLCSSSEYGPTQPTWLVSWDP
ncbi:concanavalin A-like lectin/glucanase domain-containing protein [Podospora fimiseda]|uniref:Concanavalin A-like lectin/glucanase domain-containing protein n=1 Tax=Podospora fimiseda TaxID=252190 RepID=A0AAN7BK93_9PEZI|nr:concanavalin A-like lectin/glucanase domain-containing protein [Podospora fimiseda]